MSSISGGTPARDALEGAITAITAAGAETPRLDAEVLLAHVLGVTRERLLTDRTLSVRGSAVRAYQDAVRRRSIEREPVAYIVGSKGFRNLDLQVDRRALVPRPETELLVEVALTLPPSVRVLDLCTGSGAVALALKDERPDLDISGSDLSGEAIELARANSESLGIDVAWSQADLLDGIADDFDAILANPPYVAESRRRELAAEILRHEPPEALFAGADGLDVIRRLSTQLGSRRRCAFVALEVGAGQAREVAGLVGAAGFTRMRAECDLSGIERVVVGERPS